MVPLLAMDFSLFYDVLIPPMQNDRVAILQPTLHPSSYLPQKQRIQGIHHDASQHPKNSLWAIAVLLLST